MPGPAFTDGAGQLCLRIDQRGDGRGGEQGNVYRCKQDAVALVLEVGEADLGRVEHLRRGVSLVAKEDQPAVGKVPLKLLCVIARHDRDPADAGLVKGGHDALGDGDGADIQHGFEVTHAGAHSRRYDDSADLHKNRLRFPANYK